MNHPHPRIWNVPHNRNPHLVGRTEELETLRRLLGLILLFVITMVLSVGCAQNTPNATAIPTVAAVTLTARSPTTEGIDENTLTENSDAESSLPACAPPISENVSLPDNFSPAFPFPRGILFSSVTVLNDNANYFQVIGYAPMDLRGADSLVSTVLPKAGYEPETDSGQADQGEGEQVETTFTGNGYRGALRVTPISDCEEVTQWTVVVLKESK